MEEQHPHAEGQTEQQIQEEVPVLRLKKMMTTYQEKKQFQVAGTKIRVERKLRRKKSIGLNIAWWVKWWERMVAEAVSSTKYIQQRKITSFISIQSNQNLHEARTTTTHIHTCKPKLPIKEHHPAMCEPRIKIPTTFVNEPKFVRGNKRGLENGRESPAKRNFSYKDMNPDQD